MSCGCKSDKSLDVTFEKDVDTSVKKNIGKEILKYTSRLIVFSLVLLLLPIFMGIIVFYTFKTIVLAKELDIKPLLLSLAKMIKPRDEDDEDDLDDDLEDEEDYFDEDQFIMLDVEDITTKTKNN